MLHDNWKLGIVYVVSQKTPYTMPNFQYGRFERIDIDICSGRKKVCNTPTPYYVLLITHCLLPTKTTAGKISPLRRTRILGSSRAGKNRLLQWSRENYGSPL